MSRGTATNVQNSVRVRVNKYVDKSATCAVLFSCYHLWFLIRALPGVSLRSLRVMVLKSRGHPPLFNALLAMRSYYVVVVTIAYVRILIHCC